MENKAMYLSTYEERENGTVYEEGYDGNNLSKLQLYDEGEDTWTVRNTYTKYSFFCPKVQISLNLDWIFIASIINVHLHSAYPTASQLFNNVCNP